MVRKIIGIPQGSAIICPKCHTNLISYDIRYTIMNGPFTDASKRNGEVEGQKCSCCSPLLGKHEYLLYKGKLYYWKLDAESNLPARWHGSGIWTSI